MHLSILGFPRKESKLSHQINGPVANPILRNWNFSYIITVFFSAFSYISSTADRNIMMRITTTEHSLGPSAVTIRLTKDIIITRIHRTIP